YIIVSNTNILIKCSQKNNTKEKVGANVNRERKDGKTLKEEIIEYLRTRIITNELKPGDRVVELDIAKKYNISRGPVREAVRLLEDQGLLEYKKNIGCIVKVLTKKEMRENYLIVSSLEKLSINLANGIIKDEHLKKMEEEAKNIAKYIEEGDIENIIEADYEIHKQIVLNTENDKLFQLWDSLKDLNYAIYLSILNKDNSIINRISKKHLKFIEVLKEQNVEKSIEEINKHYEGSFNYILD
ncbi:MAG: GntR family transcriptional regulator, partial [Bacillota bacterium]|nr:GntR family transcriptional regulator [Bacillota bacterium]